jgi:hypothetical protein
MLQYINSIISEVSGMMGKDFGDSAGLFLYNAIATLRFFQILGH